MAKFQRAQRVKGTWTKALAVSSLQPLTVSTNKVNLQHRDTRKSQLKYATQGLPEANTESPRQVCPQLASSSSGSSAKQAPPLLLDTPEAFQREVVYYDELNRQMDLEEFGVTFVAESTLDGVSSQSELAPATPSTKGP